MVGWEAAADWMGGKAAVASLASACQDFGGGATGGGLSGTGTGKGSRRYAQPTEDEIFGILGALTSFGQMGKGHGGAAAAGAFQEKVSELPGTAREMLRQALASLAAFALERFERGEVKVNSVRQMLDRMNQEIENLRKILGAHEEKMTEAGVIVETHREILDRQFWAAVPDNGKRQVLLSEEAWCIPPHNVQSFVGQLIERGDIGEAVQILAN